MKKYLLPIVILLFTQWTNATAQLFNSPDTVCVHQPVTLSSNVTNASSYYFGFCSGFLMDVPTGTNLGAGFQFNGPGGIDIVQDTTGNFFGFVTNSNTGAFLRLNYGNSLDNIPTVTNFGNLGGGLPANPTSLYILRDTFSGNWYVFLTAGYTQATSALARIDFGPSLNNPMPNIANMGNFTGVLNGPKGVFVAEESDGHWYGYLVNRPTSELVKLDFGFNISNTPDVINLHNTSGVLNTPSDMAAIRDNGMWYLFAINDSTTPGGKTGLVRINLGPNLNPDPAAITAADSGNLNSRLLAPSSISITRDCGTIYAYITDSTTNQLIAVQMTSPTGAYTAIDYNNVGLMNGPSGISSILRNGDNISAFICNAADSTLTRLDLFACHHSSIPSFTEVAPPTYTYDSASVYNVYFVVDQGLPTMQVECHAITVLNPPPIYMNTDTTLCEGDTIRLHVVSNMADSIIWSTGYAIDTTNLRIDSVRVYPDYSTNYMVRLYYPDGCIVDTSVNVHVSKVKADAGPDRTIADGSYTVLGGPYTSVFGKYYYHWGPFQYLSDSTIPNPVSTAPYDYTYYLTVVELNDSFFCHSSDTVVVHINCGDFILPNAFSPGGENSYVNTFRILNHDIVKLNYFRVYNRWGQEVFETSDPTEGWDGMFNGKLAPVDVYVWTADGFCASGLQVTKHGSVSLLR